MPTDANIIDITFDVYYLEGDTGDLDEYVCSLYVMSNPWVASEITWINAANNKKWEQLDLDTKYYDADLQDTITYPGGGDRLFPCVAVTPVASANHQWETFYITEAVKKYVKNPGSFHGLLLKPYLGNIGRWYASSEYSDQEKRPKLTIKYSGTGIVPKLHRKASLQNLVRITLNSVQLYVPLKNRWIVSMMDITGRIINTFSGAGQTWNMIPEKNLVDGMNIIHITDGHTKIVSKCMFLK